MPRELIPQKVLSQNEERPNRSFFWPSPRNQPLTRDTCSTSSVSFKQQATKTPAETPRCISVRPRGYALRSRHRCAWGKHSHPDTLRKSSPRIPRRTANGDQAFCLLVPFLPRPRTRTHFGGPRDTPTWCHYFYKMVGATLLLR